MKVIFYSLSVIVALSGCTLIGQRDLGPGGSREECRTLAEEMRLVSDRCICLHHELSDPNSLKKLERLSASGGDMHEMRALLNKLDADLHQLSEVLVEQSKEADNSEYRETVRRMRSLRFPFVRFDPPQTLYDGIKFLAEGAKNHPDGNGLAFPIIMTMDCGDQLYVASDGSMTSYSKKPIWYPVLPSFAVSDISYYDLLKLICESVEFGVEITPGMIRVSRLGRCVDDDSDYRFEDFVYPAPLINPDRDWLAWLENQGVVFRKGTQILYEKARDRLVVHIDVCERELFENAIPLIYQRTEGRDDVR